MCDEYRRILGLRRMRPFGPITRNYSGYLQYRYCNVVHPECRVLLPPTALVPLLVDGRGTT
jgi:hypothetical protein